LKFSIMLYSPSSYYFAALLSKYSLSGHSEPIFFHQAITASSSFSLLHIQPFNRRWRHHWTFFLQVV
jgi:hypothetical protein